MNKITKHLKTVKLLDLLFFEYLCNDGDSLSNRFQLRVPFFYKALRREQHFLILFQHFLILLKLASEIRIFLKYILLINLVGRYIL